MRALTHTAVVAVAALAAVLVAFVPEINSALAAGIGVAAVLYTALWGGHSKERGHRCEQCGHHH